METLVWFSLSDLPLPWEDPQVTQKNTQYTWALQIW